MTRNSDQGNSASSNRRLDLLQAELDRLNNEIEQLQQTMLQQLFFDTPEGNRRQMADDERASDRRQGERRTPERAIPGRRQNSDRRVPLENRWPELGLRISQLVEQSVALQQEQLQLQTHSQ
ncbi:MAG TPA: hypothetical protein VF681_08500 [Abditibacteriaceae bacterium]|jgi:hypothetical protein